MLALTRVVLECRELLLDLTEPRLGLLPEELVVILFVVLHEKFVVKVDSRHVLGPLVNFAEPMLRSQVQVLVCMHFLG